MASPICLQPLMRRFQTALKNRLHKQLGRLNVELREKVQWLFRPQAATQRQQAQDQLEGVRSQCRTSQAVSQLQSEVENLALRLFYMQVVNADLHSDITAMKNTSRKPHSEKPQAETHLIQDQPNLSLPPLSTRITKHVTIIERKQATINVYNKKIEQLVASTGHEDLGLLEIQASTLTKQLEEVGGEIKEQQQLWLLVRLSQEKQARIAARIAALLTLQAQFTILQQRKVCTERGGLRELQHGQASLSSSLQDKQLQLGELHRARTVLTSDFHCLQDTKERNLARLVSLQGRAKQLQAVHEGRYSTLSTGEALEPALQEERLHAVTTILHRVQQEFPQHQGALRRLSLALATCLQTPIGQETH
ncbi:coiled-coil domain-containing protein 40-like [Oncorhynchus nerka]|uniref:coiled-coil domain-containing protein 40-like n=1 Tax=Oncorhynchus nerka TaxID=8023 RepID=UPI0031B82236